jgi:pimeloyl-ACP methyl ester carboxylesterase
LAKKDSQVRNIVLVHGAWADGSSWSGVIEKLQADGYRVTAPQFPLSSLANDVARLRQVLALSHVAMTSHPKETAELIEKAVEATSK